MQNIYIDKYTNTEPDRGFTENRLYEIFEIHQTPTQRVFK